MAKRINVKLIMDLSAGGLTQNEIANSRHFSKTSVSLVSVCQHRSKGFFSHIFDGRIPIN